VLCNGLGQYDSSAAAAQRACGFDHDPGSLLWVMPELAEAASHAGMADAAAWACDRFEEVTSSSSTGWGLGIQARTRALVSNGEDAERRYREAIARLEQDPAPR
jgi:hypothetical protein